MARINVFLKDQLLDKSTRKPREGTNRSALIQAALENYIEAKRRGARGGGKTEKDAGSLP